MIKKTNEEYQSLSIRIEPEQALSIRTNIILATAQTFRPDMFIVDKEPHGLKREVLPTLEWMKQHSRNTTVILGLRDILDESEVVIKDWNEKGIYASLAELYDQIWVYGNQEIYDPITQYKIPEEVCDKVTFTGYIPRKELPENNRKRIRRQYRIMDDDIFVLVTTGGGGDGLELLDNYLAMHEYFPASLPLKTVMITGPFMPKSQRQNIQMRAKRHGIKAMPFNPRLEELLNAADIVISMGGYNTICEILTQKTPALIIPRETPRQEQLIRATCLKERGLLDFIPWTEVTPQRLREKIFSIIADREQYLTAMNNFKLSGLDTMLTALEQLKQKRPL
jgi:predicted glycosyltransferase